MNKNYAPLLAVYTLSLLLVMTSANWFLMWLSMELNSLMFLCLIFSKHDNLKTESMLVYFLIQSIGSLLFLFSFSHLEMKSIPFLSLPSWLIMMSIFLKMGAAPLHNWFIPAAVGCKNLSLWLILSMQKSIPLIAMLMYDQNLSILLLGIAASCCVVGSSMNLKQNSMKMIIILSSISHMAWLLSSSLSPTLLEYYFIIYSTMTYLLMNYMHLNMASQKLSKSATTEMMINLMVLGGMPPLMGFLAKMMVINSVMEKTLYFLLTSLIMFSVVDLFVYSRASLPILLEKKNSLKWMKKKKLIMKTLVFNTLSMLVILF